MIKFSELQETNVAEAERLLFPDLTYMRDCLTLVSEYRPSLLHIKLIPYNCDVLNGKDTDSDQMVNTACRTVKLSQPYYSWNL